MMSPVSKHPDVIEANLDLLDHQLLEREGTPCGNVDDLDLEVFSDGAPPRVTAILTGTIALGPRIGGRLGRWIASIASTLHPLESPEPVRIDLRDVVSISSAVTIDKLADDLGSYRSELWFRDNLIGRIPGARHESE